MAANFRNPSRRPVRTLCRCASLAFLATAGIFPLAAQDLEPTPSTPQTTVSVPVTKPGKTRPGVSSGNAPPKPLSPVEQFRLDSHIQLEAGTFGEADRVQAERLLSQAKDADRTGLILILGRYQRALLKQPVEALTVLGVEVIDKAQMETWRMANVNAEKAALLEWRQANAKAKVERAEELPPKPVGPFVPFPPLADWKITESNCACALEMANCLADLHDLQGAFAVINAITAKFEHVPRILANECAGDLLIASLRFEQAASAYEFALRTEKATATYLGTESSDDDKALRERIRQKLNNARKQLELNKYGPGWVAYRDADLLRKRQKRYLEAILRYEDIQYDFPNTIWAEAAAVYQIECLLELSKTNNAIAAEETIKRAERDLRGARLEAAGGMNLSAQRKAELPTVIANLGRDIQRMRAVPKGESCVQAAERLATTYLRRNEFGLYRGEILMELAEYSFTQQLNPNEAQIRFDRAWAWLEKVDALDQTLASYDVPHAVLEVSAPPKQVGAPDYFGNFKYADPKPGTVINRNTCSWYLNALRARCVLAKGFLEFSRGKSEEALNWYAQLEKFDGRTAFYAKRGQTNDFARMKWGAEHGYLYAYPEELARFQSRQRFVVLMADFYFCTERFTQARELYLRLLKGEFGQLPDAAADFPQFGVAASTYYLGDRKKAFEEYLKVFAKRDGTITETRAAYSAANISSIIPDPEIQAKGTELMRGLAYSRAENMYAYQAMIIYGRQLVREGRRKDGYDLLRAVPQKSNEYYELAQYYLNQYLVAEKQGEQRE